MIGSVILYSIGGLLALAVSVFSLFTLYLRYIEWKFSHIPSPKPASFYLGHLANISQMRKKNKKIPLHEVYAKFHEECNLSSVYYIRFFHQPILMITDPNAIKDVAMQPKNPKSKLFKDKLSYLFGERFLGDGLNVVIEYDKWKPRRRLYDLAFKKSYLESLLPIFNGCVDLFIEKLRSSADGVTPVLMKQHINEVTLDVVSKVVFGTNFTAQNYSTKFNFARRQQFSELVFDSFCGVEKNFSNPFFRLLHPLKAREFAKSARAMRTIGRECIKKRIELIESGAEVPNDILTYILRVASTQTTIDIELLVDDFVTFYTAGQETTGSLLGFTLVMVCTHPAVLERLQDEVKEVLNGATTVTADHLKKLKYTEQVLLETLRLHPPVIGFFKESPPDGLTVDDYHIPGGTQLLMSTANLCRSPEYFDEPNSFNPENFGPERTPPSSFVFFPFGLGHRACIGKQFAMMEAKMVLARLVQTYLITLPSDYKLVPILKTFMQPKGHLKCTIELR